MEMHIGKAGDPASTLCGKSASEVGHLVPFDDYILARGPFCETCQKRVREQLAIKGKPKGA